MEWRVQRANSGSRGGFVESWFAQLPVDAEIVHVVRLYLDKRVAEALDILDPQERARAETFVFGRDRRRFIAAHAWTRLVLARCFVCFSFRPKPEDGTVEVFLSKRSKIRIDARIRELTPRAWDSRFVAASPCSTSASG